MGIHAARRMIERYGIPLSRKLRREMVEQIQSAKAEFLGRTSARVTKWRVTTSQGVFPVCYDTRRKEIVTVLPPKRPIERVADEAERLGIIR